MRDLLKEMHPDKHVLTADETLEERLVKAKAILSYDRITSTMGQYLQTIVWLFAVPLYIYFLSALAHESMNLFYYLLISYALALIPFGVQVVVLVLVRPFKDGELLPYNSERECCLTCGNICTWCNVVLLVLALIMLSGYWYVISFPVASVGVLIIIITLIP